MTRVRLSVIIPSYNRPQRLERCLEGLAAQVPSSGAFEVIVVDDGSEPRVEETLHRFHGRLQLLVLRQDNAGPARARNTGAKHARGEWLAFLDDDCVPRPDWLRNLGAAATQHPGCLLGGQVHNACPENIFAEANHRLAETTGDWFRRTNSPLQFFASNNFVVPAADFQEVGGFDPIFRLAGGEDRELCSRWLQSGRSLAEAREAWIDHYHPQDLGTFLRMHFRYGSGAAHLHRRRKSSPWAFVSSRLYGRVLKAFLRKGADPRPFLLLLLSQAATFTGYLAATLKPVSPVRSDVATVGGAEPRG